MNKIFKQYFSISKKLIQDSKKEYLIQVDNQNKVIGKISKYEAHLKKNLDQNILHRAFSIYLIDPNQGLLLQQRSSYKATFANLWTNTCCSHPLYNDQELDEVNNIGLKRAAQRRLNYELNIYHDNLEDFQIHDHLIYRADDDNEFGEYECNLKR